MRRNQQQTKQADAAQAAARKPYAPPRVRQVKMFVSLAGCTSTGCPFGMECNTATGQCEGGP